jgi:hypothetical protein
LIAPANVARPNSAACGAPDDFHPLHVRQEGRTSENREIIAVDEAGARLQVAFERGRRHAANEWLFGAALDVLHREAGCNQCDIADVANAAVDQVIRRERRHADRRSLQASSRRRAVTMMSSTVRPDSSLSAAVWEPSPVVADC